MLLLNSYYGNWGQSIEPWGQIASVALGSECGTTVASCPEAFIGYSFKNENCFCLIGRCKCTIEINQPRVDGLYPIQLASSSFLLMILNSFLDKQHNWESCESHNNKVTDLLPDKCLLAKIATILGNDSLLPVTLSWKKYWVLNISHQVLLALNNYIMSWER